MKTLCFLLLLSFLCFKTVAQLKENNNFVIAKGQMPNITRDNSNHIHVVYGSGDSIMYVSSNNGRSFTSPALVAILPKLFASAMRGPQIAAAGNGLIITACDKNGNIFSYEKESSGKWTKAVKINDENEVAKEALMGLSSDGLNAFAVWLGVKKPRGQNLYGARSTDGGKTWSKNILVYASPDSTVCECCKPSVAIEKNMVYVMFRNQLAGYRDLYLISSADGGNSFEQAQKLGTGSWKLNGCPMDGGGLVINKTGTPETIWRREEKIYASAPGKAEVEIGAGRSCSIESVKNKNIYAWTENGNVIVVTPDQKKINIGKGSLPLVKAFDDDRVICIWEFQKEIHASVIML